MIYWPSKPAGAVLDYEFDFTDFLAAGETIISKTVTATGVTVNSSAIAGSKIQVWLAAGALGGAGVVSCSIGTNQSRTDAETAILAIGEEPVSLNMAKAQCRADGITTDADYLLELAQAAREHAEAYCGIRLMPTAVGMTFGSFAALERLSQAPIQSLVDVRYLDTAGVEQVLDPTTYELIETDADPLRPALRLAFGKSWPATRAVADAVRVHAVAGYTAVPRPVLRAMLLLIGQWYDERSAIAVNVRGIPSELPHSVTALLANHRR